MIIWLASYPRSGNTFVRLILFHVFGLKTYSIYNDPDGIGSDIKISNVVGHKILRDQVHFQNLKCDENLHIIKTHEYPTDKSPVIYVVRDGRDALNSYYHYQRNIGGRNISVEDIIRGNTGFGSWGDHLKHWSPYSRANALIIRYEHLQSNINSQIERISNFIDIAPKKTLIPSFKDLHRIHPTFFRNAKSEEWRDLFNKENLALFWQLHGETMSEYHYGGY